MTRHKAFQTAAARRRQDPIVWTIDDVEVHLRASVDVGAIGVLMETLQSFPAEDDNPMMSALKRRSSLLDAISTFVMPESMDNFQKVADDLDFVVLSQMSTELIREYSGTANPTKPESFSDGSAETGASSTDGAVPEV